MLRKIAIAAMVLSVSCVVMAGPLQIPVSYPQSVEWSLDDATHLYDARNGEPVNPAVINALLKRELEGDPQRWHKMAAEIRGVSE